MMNNCNRSRKQLLRLGLGVIGPLVLGGQLGCSSGSPPDGNNGPPAAGPSIPLPDRINLLEDWSVSMLGIYFPNDVTGPVIEGDIGKWIVGDTVSSFSECGPVVNTVEVNDALVLRSTESSSSCSDNVWVTLFTKRATFLTEPINPDLSIPLTPGARLSFESIGALLDPQPGSSGCINPPCGDTISLRLEESSGTVLAYVTHRAPSDTPNSSFSYNEILLDPDLGVYSRDLFEDFSTVPGFDTFGEDHEVVSITFEVDEIGSSSIDKIRYESDPNPVDEVYYVGFYGADPTQGVDAIGNWFMVDHIVRPLGVTNMYTATGASGPGLARRELFDAIDVNDDFIVTAAEIAVIDLRVFGYSLGGAAALQFAKDISEPQGAPPANADYEVQAPIPITVLVTIDPAIPSLEFPRECNLSWCVVPDTVGVYRNFFQRRGGATIFGGLEGTAFEDGIETPVGGLVRGTEVEKTNRSIQIEVAFASRLITGNLCDGNRGALCETIVNLQGDRVAHDGITWFVANDVVALLR